MNADGMVTGDIDAIMALLIEAQRRGLEFSADGALSERYLRRLNSEDGAAGREESRTE